MNIQNNFTREEIAEWLHNEFGLTKKDCVTFVNDILETIIEGLKIDGYVKIHNFGSFKIKRKKSIVLKAKIDNTSKLTAKGNKKDISKSNIKNKIATI